MLGLHMLSFLQLIRFHETVLFVPPLPLHPEMPTRLTQNCFTSSMPKVEAN